MDVSFRRLSCLLSYSWEAFLFWLPNRSSQLWTDARTGAGGAAQRSTVAWSCRVFWPISLVQKRHFPPQAAGAERQWLRCLHWPRLCVLMLCCHGACCQHRGTAAATRAGGRPSIGTNLHREVLPWEGFLWNLCVALLGDERRRKGSAYNCRRSVRVAGPCDSDSARIRPSARSPSATRAHPLARLRLSLTRLHLSPCVCVCNLRKLACASSSLACAVCSSSGGSHPSSCP